ncbi:MAG: CocE/NonD family hydrolase [Acidobacteria bacterium]|jgi:putative CocE/NonD family hydrolase|nr:CocE/NonD family hydrolase [Acidobacteriota bacterium]
MRVAPPRTHGPAAPRTHGLFFLFAALIVLGALGGADRKLGAQAGADIRAAYTKSEQMIPMRDGVKLFTIVYTPKDTSAPYPFMLHRTPYGSPPYGADAYRATLGPSADFVTEKFIFVYQDVRGKFRSEGDFVVMRPLVPTPKGPRATDESTDTYDTIDWLVKNVPNNNGRVGQWGISYPGSQTVWGMIDAHPALKASSPQAPAIDMFLGDDFHHNGAFRLMYTFSWLAGNARPRAGATETRGGGFDYGTPDGYRFFLDAGPVANINEKFFNYSVPTWNEYMDHPNYDAYWERQNPLKYATNVKHAVLNVAGWFDAEDFYGPLETYRQVERATPANKNRIVIGPWLHGGWASMPGDALGDIRFGSQTGDYYRREVEFPFFTHHLKDKGAAPTAEATMFETGGNTWRTFDAWPPTTTESRTLYFQADGGLSFSPPTAATAASGGGFDEYVSDPSKPVPWSTEARTTQGHLWMVEDQRFAATRPDVLVYRTEPLTEDVVIAGPIFASIIASTTGTDADWVVKLIDVYPGTAPDNTPNPRGIRMGDFQMLLAGEVFRGRYRNSFSTPEALVPNQPVKYEFDLRDRFHRFLKGHRIMVQVQSTWFPVIDRNPQTFVDIYKAKPTDFQKATHRVYRTAAQASGVRVGVLK